MIDKFKNDFNELLNNDDVDNFGFVIDKKNGKIVNISLDDLNKLNLNSKTNTDTDRVYDLEQLTNLFDKLTNQTQDLQDDIHTNQVVLSCAQTLLEKNSFEVSITKLLGILCDFYGGDFACLFERDYETSTTNVNYKYHKTNVNLIDKQYTKSFKISQDDEWTRYLKEHAYAFLQTSDDIDSKLAGSSYYDRFMKSSRDNLLVVSLNDNDFILGGIEIDNITKNIDKVELIKTVSAFIVNNLHIKNSHLMLEKNVQDLENKNTLNSVMLECVKTLVYDDNIEVAMNNLLENITEYYNADITNIFYNTTKKDVFTCCYSYSIKKDNEMKIPSLPISDIINLFNTFDVGGVGYISSVREMADILDNTFNDTHMLLQQSRINSLLFVPLIINSKTVGFMGVENPKRHLNETFLIKTTSTFVINHITKNELLSKLEKLSYSDSLTGLYNRNFYNNYVDEFKINPHNSVGVIFADVNGLKKANDNFGHELGDKLIRWSAKFFDDNVNGLNFRIGGDEFVCILENTSKQDFDLIVNDIKEKINSYGEVHISIGNAWAKDFPDIEAVIGEADVDMYVEKKAYYKELANDERSIKSVLQEFKISIEKLEV